MLIFFREKNGRLNIIIRFVWGVWEAVSGLWLTGEYSSVILIVIEHYYMLVYVGDIHLDGWISCLNIWYRKRQVSRWWHSDCSLKAKVWLIENSFFITVSVPPRVNCSFYFKIGACRHGERCSRIHNKPTFSQTILLSNLYQNPQNNAQSAEGALIPGNLRSW